MLGSKRSYLQQSGCNAVIPDALVLELLYRSLVRVELADYFFGGADRLSCG
jgi:hypothetical protein